MACACNKNKSGSQGGPAGFGKQAPAASLIPPRGSVPQPSTPPAGSTAAKTVSTSYALRTESGQTQTFGSRLERDAAQRRTGGTILDS